MLAAIKSSSIFITLIWEETLMPTLSMGPLTLGHTAITLIAIVAGLMTLAAMLKGQNPKGLTATFLLFTFLLFTVLTSVTGFVFFPITKLTPGLILGTISLIDLAVAFYALYGQGLAGGWRATYVVAANLALYFNVFVLVAQCFQKIPPLSGQPSVTGGPLFGAVQGLVLLTFLVMGRRAVKRFHPI